MDVFTFVFLMLMAILASNLINRFIPAVSTPIIQIALGALIGLLPLGFHLELEPEWFFVLFIAPLLFYDALVANKEALWAQRKPIFLLAFGLVFLTVLIIGFLADLIVPSMPLAAAFALAAAVTPTDAVAVGALAKRIHIPHNIMHLLEGESLINDASGLVSFQFAVAAMVTGTFSLVDAGIELVVVVVGGVLVGALLSWLKYLLVRWVRTLGMEDVTFHLLIGILTPFVIYLVAEEFHVSGILAVVTAGIIHSFEARRINPEVVSLRIASESVWQTFVYVLNGLVFVILGTQLPDILESVRFTAQVDQRIVWVEVVAITAALMLIRFGWAYFTLPRESLEGEGHKPLGRVRASAITSMAGVRGAVTLASTLSLPFVLADGSPFPFRDTIIFIASIVILLSLLVANFLLPLLLDGESKQSSAEDLTGARVDLLQGVVKQLNAQSTGENTAATSQVMREYLVRISELESKRSWSRADRDMEERLRAQALVWERESTLAYVEENKISPERAQVLIDSVDQFTQQRRKSSTSAVHRMTRWLKLLRGARRIEGTVEERAAKWRVFYGVSRANATYVIEKLRAIEDASNRRVVDKLIADYELAIGIMEQRFAAVAAMSSGDETLSGQSDAQLAEITKIAMQLERDGIQRLFEEGRISRVTAAEMRNNLGMVALRMQRDLFLDEEELAPA